jgi:hypothetical protein
MQSQPQVPGPGFPNEEEIRTGNFAISLVSLPMNLEFYRTERLSADLLLLFSFSVLFLARIQSDAQLSTGQCWPLTNFSGT